MDNLTADKSDTDVHIASGYLVDADGDGVEDSRWVWAPIQQISGVSYVMAIRIVDNSSLINANVALSQVDTAGNYDSDTDLATTAAPRWWTPAELDLGAFMGRYGDATWWSTETVNLINFRTGQATAMPTSWGQRRGFWYDGPRYYGDYQNSTVSLSVADELELRYRNGLNNLETKTMIEDDASVLLYNSLRQSRASQGLETHYTHYSAWPPSAPSGSHDWAAMLDFFDNNPRGLMTVRSGAAALALPVATSGNASSDRAKVNINGDDDVITVGDRNMIANEILDVVTDAGGPFPLPVSVSTTQEFASQFAVNIVDFADPDNRLTMIDPDGTPDTGDERYGFEALPVITEGYIQAKYDVTTVGGSAPNWNVTWTLQGNVGYAIEIRNPFAKKILLWNVNLWVNGQDWGTLNVLTGQAEMDAGEVIVLYRDSNGNLSGLDSMISLFNGTVTSVPMTQNWPTTAGPTVDIGDVNDQIDVELRAQDDSGAPLTWAYVKIAVEAPPDVYTAAMTDNDDPTGSQDYYQQVSLGNGNGLNMLTVRPSEITINDTARKKPAIDSLSRSTSLSALGLANKIDPARPTAPADESNALTTQQIVISDREQVQIGASQFGRIVHIGQLAQVPVIGPSPVQTIADSWNDADDVSDVMLRFDAAAPLVENDADNDLAVPHAVAILERFTTVSPAMDGLDNDGDTLIDIDGATPDADEMLVPGTININTVSGDLGSLTRSGGSHLLQWALPIPDDITRDDTIRAIIRYREKLSPFNLTSRGPGIAVANYRNRRGIARISELFNVNDATDSINALDMVGAMAMPGDDRLLNNTLIDFETPDSMTGDGIADDREEKMMIAPWLMQVLSTRSDIFTAYVLIQGYPAEDFTLGAVEAARFLAVFDRSGVSSNSDSVRVLGVYRLE